MKDITNKILPILHQYNIKKAAFFGSYARGDFDEKSDVDILIEPPKNMGMSFVSLKLALEDSLHKKIDLITYNSLSPYLKESILQNQQSIL